MNTISKTILSLFLILPLAVYPSVASAGGAKMLVIRVENLEKKEIESTIKLPLWLANVGVKIAKIKGSSDLDLVDIQAMLKEMKNKKGVFFEVNDHIEKQKVAFSIE